MSTKLTATWFWYSVERLFAFSLLFVSPFVLSVAQASQTASAELLGLSIEELMDVEIFSASKQNEKIKDIPASIIVVTRKDIERYGYNTLTDVIRNVPGFYDIYNYAGAPSNFGVRGFWNSSSQNSNIAILVNGVSQVFDNDRSNPMARINVPVEAIDRVEVIRGPMAVIYGNGASFGVINIITNKATEEHRVNLGSASYGSRNTRKGVARLSGIGEDRAIVINASRYRSDGLDHKFKDMMSAANFAMLPALGVSDPGNYSTDGLLEQDSRYLGVSGRFGNWVFDFSYNETDIGLFELLPPIGDGFQRNEKATSLMLGYREDLSDWFTLDGRAVYNTSDRSDVAEVLVPGAQSVINVDFDAWEFELVSTITPRDDLRVIAGVDVRTMRNHNDFTNAPLVGVVNESFKRDDRVTRAFFTQATYQATQDLKLVAGLRYEDLPGYDANGITNGGQPNQGQFSFELGNVTTTSPRLAAIYEFDRSNVVKLLYGEANRLANDQLNPEVTKTTEINYIHKAKRFYTSVSLFRNKLEDLVIEDLVIQPDGSVENQDRNAGELSTLGMEVLLNGEINEHISAELGVTYQDTDDDSSAGAGVAYSPHLLIHAKSAYTHGPLTLALLGRYVSSMKPLYDLTKQNPDGSFGARIGNKVGSYYSVDVNMRHDKVWGDLYLDVKFTNIFDKTIRYPNNQETNEILDRGTLGAGRAVMGSIGFKF